ncbi:MAG TPA: mannosyltransferase family protein [Bacillota bacterium]|nr:mannosyltransferase family protein [Bacillota bacterium]
MKKLPWLNLSLIYGLHILVVLSSDFFGQNLLAAPKAPLPVTETILNGLANWDGRWYLRIVESGYDPKAAAFFPGYPALIAVLQNLGIEPLWGAVIAANLAFLGVLISLYCLLSLDFAPDVILRSLWYLALFPTAFFFSAVYTESLYLLLVILCLYFARRHYWLASGCMGMLACLTRSAGVLLLFPLLYEFWHEKRLSFTTTSWRGWLGLAPFGLLPAGLLIYMYHLWATLGQPLAFMTAQQYWKRQAAVPWAPIIKTLGTIGQGNNLVNFLFTALALVLLILGISMLRPSYSLYGLFGILLPLCTPATHSPLLSMPRFVLVLFPIYVVLALVIRRQQLHWALISFFTMALVFLNILFANSRWVA